MTYRTFEPGQKVRSVYGKVYTVRSQNGCQVFVDEILSGHVHPAKIFPVQA